MRKSGSDDMVYLLTPKKFAESVVLRSEIDPEVAKELYSFFVESIKEKLMEGFIVRIDKLGYFYLHMMNRAFFLKHLRYGNVESKVIVKPNFRPSVGVLASFTKKFGEENVFDGLELMAKYEDKIADSERCEHEIIKNLATRNYPQGYEEELLKDYYDKEIKRLEKRVLTLKKRYEHDLQAIRRENNVGK